jgi:hypothetical protein
VSRDREPIIHVRAHTWLANDMLRGDQTPLIEDGTPGDRLGESWLPPPLRRTVLVGRVGDGGEQGARYAGDSGHTVGPCLTPGAQLRRQILACGSAEQRQSLQPYSTETPLLPAP